MTDGPEDLDIVGLEFGRLLVTETFTAETNRPRDRYRAQVLCSCGWSFSAAVENLLRGKASRCFRCRALFRERYGQDPEPTTYRLDDVRRMIEERDAEDDIDLQPRELDEVDRLRVLLNL